MNNIKDKLFSMEITRKSKCPRSFFYCLHMPCKNTPTIRVWRNRTCYGLYKYSKCHC